MQKIEVGKTYRHYKGNRYTIVAIAEHSETNEQMIVYQSCDTAKIWVRPMKMWNETVDKQGTLRFTLEED